MTEAATGAAPDGSGVLHYVLTPEDAMAWEVRSPRIRRRDRVAIGAGIFAGIGLIKLIGTQMAELKVLHSLSMAVVIMGLPVLLVLWLQGRDHRKRAAERVAKPVGVQLEYSRDRVVERREDRSEVLAFGSAGLSEILETPTHVFLSTGSDVVILPARAFATPAAREAFVAHWRGHLE